MTYNYWRSMKIKLNVLIIANNQYTQASFMEEIKKFKEKVPEIDIELDLVPWHEGFSSIHRAVKARGGDVRIVYSPLDVPLAAWETSNESSKPLPFASANGGKFKKTVPVIGKPLKSITKPLSWVYGEAEGANSPLGGPARVLKSSVSSNEPCPC